MKANINKAFVSNIAPKSTQFDVRDIKLTGFLIRVTPSGKMQYVCQYKRGRRISIGNVHVITPVQARLKAQEILGNAAQGIYPNKQEDSITFKQFINKEYACWNEQHNKSAKEIIRSLRSNFFKVCGNHALNQVKNIHIEKWRTNKLKDGRKPSTVNRAIGYLKTALSKAVEWEFLPTHPLTKIKALKENNECVRYLNKEESKRIREAIDQREQKLKTARKSFNLWRKKRGYGLLPEISDTAFADYLKPMLLLAMNTGMRRGEIFNLTWNKINFDRKFLTIPNPKNNKARHIPLNHTTMSVLQTWQKQSKKSGLVFTNKDGDRFNNITKSWKSLLNLAQITNFRFHDLRHDFASKLVMAGVDLNTVRELLGHSDIKMTLRYAHLAPEHKANAVAKLDKLI
ncbi:MAG: recombinase [Thiotrichales bacterium]|nr:MAG: recombinase [Thiotrichales bacterium]